MTKKNIRPQQAAPVQREIVEANSSAEGKMTAKTFWGINGDPFAGDDAE